MKRKSFIFIGIVLTVIGGRLLQQHFSHKHKPMPDSQTVSISDPDLKNEAPIQVDQTALNPSLPLESKPITESNSIKASSDQDFKKIRSTLEKLQNQSDKAFFDIKNFTKEWLNENPNGPTEVANYLYDTRCLENFSTTVEKFLENIPPEILLRMRAIDLIEQTLQQDDFPHAKTQAIDALVQNLSHPNSHPLSADGQQIRLAENQELFHILGKTSLKETRTVYESIKDPATQQAYKPILNLLEKSGDKDN